MIMEPYSELEDYLDKDDFSNLLGVLGSFAGKTSSGLLSLGEGILDRFTFKSNQKYHAAHTNEQGDIDDDYIVPG